MFPFIPFHLVRVLIAVISIGRNERVTPAGIFLEGDKEREKGSIESRIPLPIPAI